MNTSYSIFPTLAKRKIIVLQVIVLLLLWSIIEATIPFLFKIIIDQGVSFGDLKMVRHVLLIQLVLIILSLVLVAFKDWLLRQIGSDYLVGLMKLFLRRIISKNFYFFSGKVEGVILQNANDTLRIEKFFTDSTFNSLNAWLKIIIFTCILSFFNMKMGVIFFSSVFLTAVYLLLLLKWKKGVDDKLFASSSKVRVQLMEIVRGIFDIKTFLLSPLITNDWNKVQVDLAKSRIKLLIIGRSFNSGIALINQVTTLILLYLACSGVVYGDFTIGTLLALQYIVIQTNKSFSEAFKIIPDYQEAQLSMNRLTAMLGSENDEIRLYAENYLEENIYTIQFEDVSFNYPNSDNGIRNIKFEFKKGDKIGVIGESGSGKSTLMKLIGNIYAPTSGSIKVNNVDIRTIHPDNYFSLTSYLSQDSYVFKGTVEFNISFIKDEELNEVQKRNVVSALSASQLIGGDKLGDLQQSSFLKREATSLSAGQKQRLLVARCLFRTSQVYLFDEPTNALDNSTATAVIDNIIKKSKEQIVFIASHKIHLLTKMDYIIVVENGDVIKIGPASEIITRQIENLYE